MKLTTVIACSNNNPRYYMFIPKQILFWKKFNIDFFAIYVGDSIPLELENYSENIILWNHNLNLNTSYIAQNLRIYYPALLNLPDNELVLITDMDMLPTNDTYYKSNLENYNKNDFIYYREVDHIGQQIYMCYNAAHPSLWSKLFNINSIEDIKKKLDENYNEGYNGIPGSTYWFTDQRILFNHLINYENLKILNRPIKRLEVEMYKEHLKNGDKNFISLYDDAHFHRNYFDNETLIIDAEKQL